MCKTPTKSLRKSFVYNNLQSLDELRRDGTFCDLTLCTKDGLNIKVHKNVMCSASGYFRGLFLCGMKESNANVLDLKNISGDNLEMIISFAYLGELKTTKPKDLEDILRHATYLQIKELSEMCVLSLIKLIDDNNCLEFWRLAEDCFERKLEEMCISYILQNARRLFLNTEILNELSVDEMKRLAKDDLLWCSEEGLFESVWKWAKNRYSNKDECARVFSEVIDFIRFPLMSTQFLASNVLQDEELLDNKQLLKKIAECARYKWDENRETSFKFNKSTLPRIGLLRKRFLALLGDNVVSINDDGVMENFQRDSHFRESFASTCFNNYIVMVCGGIQRKGLTKSCEYFSTLTKKWKHFPSLKVDRCNHECIFFEDKIYACGGFGSFKSVDVFDIGTEKWTIGSQMSYGFWNFGLTKLNRSLYTVGGMDCFTICRFDPRTPEGWSTVYRQAQQASLYTKCVSVYDDIYCFRDSEQPRIFDPRMNKTRIWECDLSSRTPAFFKTCELDNKIGILFGNGEFMRYNVKGDIEIKSKANKTDKRTGERIGALLSLYY